MSATYPDGGIVVTGARGYYEQWCTAVTASPGFPAVPAWDELSGSALTAWMLAYAATIEAAAHNATAIALTVDLSPEREE